MTAREHLPPELVHTLQRSAEADASPFHKTLHGWQQDSKKREEAGPPTEAQLMQRLSAAQLHTITEVHDRMTAAGINWADTVKTITNTWEKNTRGMHIEVAHGDSASFVKSLLGSPKFAETLWGNEAREVITGPGLHIVDDGGRLQVHVDSKQFVESKGSFGDPHKANYDIGESIPHFVVDKLGWDRDPTPFEKFDDWHNTIKETLRAERAHGESAPKGAEERKRVLDQIEGRLNDLAMEVKQAASQGSHALEAVKALDIGIETGFVNDALDWAQHTPIEVGAGLPTWQAEALRAAGSPDPVNSLYFDRMFRGNAAENIAEPGTGNDAKSQAKPAETGTNRPDGSGKPVAVQTAHNATLPLSEGVAAGTSPHVTNTEIDTSETPTDQGVPSLAVRLSPHSEAAATEDAPEPRGDGARTMPENGKAQVEAVRDYLRQAENLVSAHDPQWRHREALVGIWHKALEVTSGEPLQAIKAAMDAVKSDRQPGETQAEHGHRLDGIPSKAFGAAEPYAGVDKPQHFFATALWSFSAALGGMEYDPVTKAWSPPMTGAGEIVGMAGGRGWEVADLIRSVWKGTGGYDRGDIRADDLGAAFGSALAAQITDPTDILADAVAGVPLLSDVAYTAGRAERNFSGEDGTAMHIDPDEVTGNLSGEDGSVHDAPETHPGADRGHSVSDLTPDDANMTTPDGTAVQVPTQQRGPDAVTAAPRLPGTDFASPHDAGPPATPDDANYTTADGTAQHMPADGSTAPTASGRDPGTQPLPGTDFSGRDAEGAQAGATVGGDNGAQSNQSLPGTDFHHAGDADGHLAGGVNESPREANFSGADGNAYAVDLSGGQAASADGSGGADAAAASGM